MKKRLAAAYIGACIGISLGLVSISIGPGPVLQVLFLSAVGVAAAVGFAIALAELTTPDRWR